MKCFFASVLGSGAPGCGEPAAPSGLLASAGDSPPAPSGVAPALPDPSVDVPALPLVPAAAAGVSLESMPIEASAAPPSEDAACLHADVHADVARNTRAHSPLRGMSHRSARAPPARKVPEQASRLG